MFLFKIFAGMLSTLAVIIGTTFAIPESREYVLNTLAPYSQVYEEQQNTNENLEIVNSTNLETIVEAEEALAVAEQATNSLQGELLSIQTALTQLTTELATAQENLLLAEANSNEQANLYQAEIDNLNALIIARDNQLNVVLGQICNQQIIIEQLNLQIENLQNQSNNQPDEIVIPDWIFTENTATYVGENNLNVVVPSSYSLGEPTTQTQRLTFNSFSDIEMYNWENNYIFTENPSVSFVSNTGYGMNYSLLEMYNMNPDFYQALSQTSIDFSPPYYCDIVATVPTYVEGADFNVSTIVIDNTTVNYTLTDNITDIRVTSFSSNSFNFNIPNTATSITFQSCGTIGNIDLSQSEGLRNVSVSGTTNVTTLIVPQSTTKVYTQPYFSSVANVVIHNSTSVADISMLFNYLNYTCSQFGHSAINIYVPDAIMQSYYELIDSYDRCVEKELCKNQIKALSTFVEV